MKVSILGSGVYAKSISTLLRESNCEIVMWTEKSDVHEVIVKKGIEVTNSFIDVTNKVDMIFILTGSKFVRSVLEGIAKTVSHSTLIILGSKGILKDGTLMSSLVEEILPDNPYAILSGPTFAEDIESLNPVGFTVATAKEKDFLMLKKCFPKARLEYSKDIVAIEMCGTLKNAYAIGSGIIKASGYGPSTTCLYITRVLEEMRTIFEASELSSTAITSLAGIGDLVLSCTNPTSRNYTLGTMLVNRTKKEILIYLESMTVEGYENLKAYVDLFAQKVISTPILSCVHDIVIGSKLPENLINVLLGN